MLFMLKSCGGDSKNEKLATIEMIAIEMIAIEMKTCQNYHINETM